MSYKLAVIGVGNMAKAIVSGIASSSLPIDNLILFDKNKSQYESLNGKSIVYYTAESIADAISEANIVLLSVKPQNYPEVLDEIAQCDDAENKLYISIGAGITAESVSSVLGGAHVVRVLPNVPMLIGSGVSVICRNDSVPCAEFSLVCDIFRSAGSNILIDECDMNPMIGVTSSSPAYVFKFINAIYEGAIAQGLKDDGDMLSAICDVVIGSATMLKNSSDTPAELIAKVASKGGTTEQALNTLDASNFDAIISEAMKACTKRADELGSTK